MTAREVVFKILADSKEYSEGITEATAALEDFKKKNKAVEDVMQKVSKQAALVATAIAATGIAVGKMAVDFNKGFSQVQTLIPGNTARIKELQKSILDLSPTVGKTTDDLTNGLYQVISAFGDSAEAVDQLTVASKAATAGAATTNDAVNLLSAVTKGYGDTSAGAQQKVSDLAFVTVKLGQTTFPELSSSIQRVTSLSNTLGVKQEELFSVFSAGTGVIGGASEVSTKLAATYNELLKPQDALQTAFKSLGVVTGNELIQNFGGLSGALDALKGYADSAGMPVSNLFGSIEAGQLALYATGAGAQKLASDLDAMSQAAGATEEAFSAATSSGVNSFGFELEQAKLNAQAFAIKLGQELIPQLQELLSPLFSAAENLANLDKETVQTIVSIGKIVLSFAAVTAVVFGLRAAIKAVTLSVGELTIALAANPIGLIAIAAVTAVVALNELAKASEKARLEKAKLEAQSTLTAVSLATESVNAIKLSKEYEKLSAQESLSVGEKERLKIITEQLKAVFPELSATYDENTGAIKLNREELIKLNEEKRKTIAQDADQAQAMLDETSKKLAESTAKRDKLKAEISNVYKEKSRADANNFAYDNAPELNSLEKQVKSLEAKEKVYKDAVNSFQETLAQLHSFDASEKEEKQQTTPKTSEKIGKDLKTQGERLKALDDGFKYEKQIIEQNGGDIVAATAEYLEKRTKLLDDFNREDLSKGMSLGQSNKSELSGSAGTIEKERIDTVTQLSDIESEANQKRLAETSQIAEKTEATINREIELRKSLGLIEGNTKGEIERNALTEKANALKEKQKSLISEYNALIESGSESDSARAAVLKGEIGELDKSVQKALNDADKTSAAVWDKVKADTQKAASAIQNAFGGLKDIFTGLISNKAEVQAQESAQKLVAIEKEKNDALFELDQELENVRYEHHQENMEREEAESEEAYQKRIEGYDQSLTDLQTSFDAETNIKNLREIEKKLEADRKKKAEEQQRKKNEAEKKKREEQQKKEEVAILNEKQEREYQFVVAQVQVENQAGDAKAKAAQEQAKWEKASTVLNLGLQAAMMTAQVAAAIAALNPVAAVLYGTAAGVALAQAAVAASAPGHANYTPQAIPQAPPPIKFAQGGIALPSSSGVPFSLPSGYPALGAEAGVPELIMPITEENIQKLLHATGETSTGAGSFNYAPVFHFAIAGENGTNPQEIFNYIKDNCARDLLETVEDARRQWFLGET